MIKPLRHPRVPALSALALATSLAVAGPRYEFIDLGLVAPDHQASQGLRVSEGGIAVGRSIGSNFNAAAFTWTPTTGLVALPKLPGRGAAIANSANDSGLVVGTASTNLSGTGSLPVIWRHGVVEQLPLPPQANTAARSVGRANDINAAGVAVGSALPTTLQRGAVYYADGSTEWLNQITSTGVYAVSLSGINDAGLAVGVGEPFAGVARNAPVLYDTVSRVLVELPFLPGKNGGIATTISNAGHIVGNNDAAFLDVESVMWTPQGAVRQLPRPIDANTGVTATNGGIANGVNSLGWVVGVASGTRSIPWFYDGIQQYRMDQLLPPGSGWDFIHNTASSAQGISENGVIVGTGILNGTIRAYAAVPFVTPVQIDILPGTCTNPLQAGRGGQVSVALLGTASLDVQQLELASIRLNGVAPERMAFEDVSGPAATAGGCPTEGADGRMDLVLKFDARALAATASYFVAGGQPSFKLSGYLADAYGGGLVLGSDTMSLVPAAGR